MTDERNNVWVSWRICWVFSAVSDLKFWFPDYLYKVLVIVPSFPGCPPKNWSQLLLLWLNRNFLSWFPPSTPTPPPHRPASSPSPSLITQVVGVTSLVLPALPSLWVLFGGVIYSWLNAEWCLEVLLQQLPYIFMPTVTLLNLFFIPETCGAGSLCSLRINCAQWLSMFSLSAFSGRHGCVSRASIWPVVHVLNSYLHSLSPF